MAFIRVKSLLDLQSRNQQLTPIPQLTDNPHIQSFLSDLFTYLISFDPEHTYSFRRTTHIADVNNPIFSCTFFSDDTHLGFLYFSLNPFSTHDSFYPHHIHSPDVSPSPNPNPLLYCRMRRATAIYDFNTHLPIPHITSAIFLTLTSSSIHLINDAIKVYNSIIQNAEDFLSILPPINI
jgi:hypothetical protein